MKFVILKIAALVISGLPQFLLLFGLLNGPFSEIEVQRQHTEENLDNYGPKKPLPKHSFCNVRYCLTHGGLG